MKGNWTVTMDSNKVEEVSADIKAWGYKSREEFVLAAHQKEKANREKTAKAGRK